MASTRTGGQLLVEGLKRWGVEVVFGLPGVQLDALFDALAEDGRIRVVHTRHEQATSYMADGYARATGRVGVCVVVPGPGVLNAGAGLATAYACNSPVLCIAGHVFGGDATHGLGALHEIPDQSAVLRGAIARSEHVRRPEDIPGVIDTALAGLNRGGRRRPMAIEVGPDVLAATTGTTFPPPVHAEPPRLPEASAVEAAVAALARCERPMIWAGGGAMDAGPALAALIGALGAPVVMTPQGRGALPDSNPLVLPPAAGFAMLGEVDAIVIVGSRFFGSAGPIEVAPGTTLIRIDADPGQLAQSPPGTLTIAAESSVGCRQLAAALAHARPVSADTAEATARRAEKIRGGVAAALATDYPQTAALCAALRGAMPDDAILVDEMTQVGYYARNGFPVTAPRTYIGAGYQGTLGFGYATALGAKVGWPDRAVVSISGDGGFLFNVAELATAVHHRINVVAVVFNDSAYGNVKGIQSRTYGREIASTLTNPDFVALARSFGAAGYHAKGPDELHDTLGAAIQRDEPAVIEVPIGPQPDMWAVLTGRRLLTPAP